jgi:hypothetical protein
LAAIDGERANVVEQTLGAPAEEPLLGFDRAPGGEEEK